MHLYGKIVELSESNVRFAVATVVQSSGSTPQKAGAKAIFEAGGTIWGTLGGGCLEAESRARALRSLDDGEPSVFDLRLDEDYGWDDGLICGGRVRILIEPGAGKHSGAYHAALSALARRGRGILVTQVTDDKGRPSGYTRWLDESDLLQSNLPWSYEDIVASLQAEKPLYRMAESTLAETCVEPVVPRPRLIVAGGGHIGQAVARLGAFLDFEVTVVDDRPAFTKVELYPVGVRTACADIPAFIGATDGGPDAYFVIVTRGHRHDGHVLAECIHKPSAYLGMIGSRRKTLLLRKQFLERRLCSEEDFERVRSPIGLDIGSVTVPEIAMSIAAELVATRRKPANSGISLNVR